MQPRLLRIVQGFLALLILVYTADWVLLRVKANEGVSNVQVEQFLKTPLKGQKEEFDYLGTVAQSCVPSLFPHRSETPCWWLRAHKIQWVTP